MIGIVDGLISADKPVHAGIVIAAGTIELALAFYLSKTTDLRNTIIAAAVVCSIVYLADFILYGNAFYFAIGFSAPIGAALFMKTRSASLTLVTYTACGIVVAVLYAIQIIQPRYESPGIIAQASAAALIMSLAAMTIMWKDRLLTAAQEKEWQQRTRFNTICDNAYGAFFEADSHGMITYARGSLIDDLGYALDDLLGRNQFDFIVRKDRRMLLQLGQPPNQEQLQYDCEIRIFDVLGRTRWVRLSGGTITEAGGKRKWVHALRDIQEAIDDRQVVFESSRLESLERVCGGLAHDFNNLLTVMKFHGEAIDDPKIRSEFQLAQAEAANLTAGMLTFARDRTLRTQEVALAEFLTKAQPLIERPIPHNIHCQWRNECGEAVLKLDPAQLQQVLINLVTNACHAMPHGGTISIVAEYRTLSPKETAQYNITGSQCVQITVSDTGTGMDSKTLSRATEPFFTTKPRGEGTGLGLSTVHGAVRHAGGSLEIGSTPGEGTVISILLPLHKKQSTENWNHTQENESTEKQHNSNSQRVALVEDRKTISLAMQTVLESSGYIVEIFPDAEQALTYFQGMPPDFMISDIMLPGMSGVDLGRKTIETHPDTKIILISGHQNHDLGIVTENSNTIRFLPKPFGATDLLDTMS